MTDRHDDPVLRQHTGWRANGTSPVSSSVARSREGARPGGRTHLAHSWSAYRNVSDRIVPLEDQPWHRRWRQSPLSPRHVCSPRALGETIHPAEAGSHLHPSHLHPSHLHPSHLHPAEAGSYLTSTPRAH